MKKPVFDSLKIITLGIFFMPFFVANANHGPINTDTSYDINILVLKYFPLKSDGTIIDTNADTGGWDLARMKQSADDQIAASRRALERATRYRGHTFPENPPALRFTIVDAIERIAPLPYITPPPAGPGPFYLDYTRVLNDNAICDYVRNKNVVEVWLFKSWAKPGYAHSESKMSGPNGDISNSYRTNEMPLCGKTYRVYTHDLQREDLFLEVWGHQLESEISTFDPDLANLFFNPCYNKTNCYPLGDPKNPVTGRCGNVHNPPNARSEYDRENPTPNNSDCLDWNPNGLGTLSPISCANWGCNWKSISDNPVLNYIVWNWQNVPGRKNEITYEGKKLRNWWDAHGDFDRMMSENEKLTLAQSPPSPVPRPAPPQVESVEQQKSIPLNQTLIVGGVVLILFVLAVILFFVAR